MCVFIPNDQKLEFANDILEFVISWKTIVDVDDHLAIGDMF